ncbi:MAG: aldo/keto reductase [Burkholderiales bacterium]|nr:aldo/keto reductase [Burkholderiales bacterium]
MQYRRLGASGPSVSALALGSWHTYRRLSFEAGVALVRRAFALGVNTFDVCYYRDQPHTEVLFGRILDVVGRNRGDYRLIEKLWFAGYSEKSFARQLDESLVRLGRDHVEAVLSEHPRPGMSVEKLTEEIADLVVRGRADCWGAMNWSIDDIRRGYEHADRLDLPLPQIAELKYNLARSGVVDSDRFRTLCADTGVTLVASDVLEGGVLAGNLEPSRGIGIDTGGIREKMKTHQPRLREIAAHFAATPAQIAIAFCLANPLVSAVLVGVTRIKQLEDNVAALRLAQEHGAALRKMTAPLALLGHVEEEPYPFNALLTPEFISD